MRNKILVGLLAVFIISVFLVTSACSKDETSTAAAGSPTTQTPTIAPGMEHYSGAGISFDFPEEWFEVGFTWEPGYDWGICLSGGTGDEPGVFVLRYDSSDMTLEEFTEYTRDIGYGGDFSITTPVPRTVNGRSAYVYNYSGSKFGALVKGDTMIITDGYSIWWVDCFALKSEYNQNKAGFETIFDTFIIE